MKEWAWKYVHEGVKGEVLRLKHDKDLAHTRPMLYVWINTTKDN